MIFLAVLCLTSCSLAQDAPRPNVIFILMDDFGYNDLGIQTFPNRTDFYPNSGPAPAQTVGANMPQPNLAHQLTPQIDSLASDGMRFTSFYANPSCTAARGCLMTGRYRSRLNIQGVFFPNSTNGLNTKEVTLPELLRERGYATGMIGKWHLGYNPTRKLPFQMMPTRHGFEEFHGLPYSNDMTPLPLVEGENIVEADVTSAASQAKLTWKYTEFALDFISRKAAKNRPFFLYMAHSMSHRPCWPSDQEFTNADGTTWPVFEGTSGISNYYDVVKEVDHSVGRILSRLDTLGIAGNTLVIFTSDNGPWKMSNLDLAENSMGSAYPLRDFKQSTLEGGVRVPFIARWPGHIDQGVVSDQVAGVVDMLPTLVGLAGGSSPSDRTTDGIDIWPILSGQSLGIVRTYAIDENSGSIPPVLRKGDWKIRSGALYNLANDVQEKTDESGNSQHAAVMADLQTELAAVQGSISGDNQPLGSYTNYEVELATDYVPFAEGGTATFAVRLSHNPGSTATVRVARFSGDATLSVASDAVLSFKPSNWATWQTVTLSDVADEIPGAATFRVTIDGQSPVREVFAIAADDAAVAVEGALVWPKTATATLDSSAVKMVAEGTVLLNASVDPAGSLYAWTKLSGPGSVTFTDAAAAKTGVSFGQNGDYILRFTADHPMGIAFDPVDFAVQAGSGSTTQAYKHAPLLAYDSAADSNGNSTWENLQSPGTRDWSLESGISRTAVDPAPQLSFIDAAWTFSGGAIPAGGSSLHLDSYSNANASIELWFKPASLPTATQQVLWETGGDIGASLTLNGNVLSFAVDDGGSDVPNGAVASAMLAPAPQRDGFVHCVGVIDLANDTIRLYVGGLLKDTRTIASVSDWCGNSHSGLGTITQNDGSETTDTAHLGGNDQLVGSFSPFVGEIAHLLFYDRALTAAEVTDLVTGPAAVTLANAGPSVSAGSDQSVSYSLGASLGGTASDDGLPSSSLSTQWTLFDGPGTPLITVPTSLNTQTAFDLPGIYQLWLEADDSEVKVYDDIEITVASLTYNEWITGFSFESGEDALLANPDGDEMKNVLEWALGKDPLKADRPEIEFSHSMLPETGKHRLTMAFDVPRNRAPAITFHESANLISWSQVLTPLPGILTLSPSKERWSMSVEIPDTEPRWFLRMDAGE
jgi:arylsulfatase A-like enzyme